MGSTVSRAKVGVGEGCEGRRRMASPCPRRPPRRWASARVQGAGEGGVQGRKEGKARFEVEESERTGAPAGETVPSRAEGGSEADGSQAGAGLWDAQVAEFSHAFRLLDTDGDGTITREELAGVFSSLGHPVGQDALDEYMARATGSRTGTTISLAQFIAAMERLAAAAPSDEDEVRSAFDVFDHDGDGYIDAAELRRVLSAYGETLTDAELDTLMADADANGDGRIDYDDFKAMMAAP